MNQTYSEPDISQRLSISTYVYRGHQPISVRTLARLAEHGIRRIEVNESPDQFDLTRADSIQHLERDCRDAGVTICAYHASHTGFTEIDTEDKRRATLDQCKRQIDTLLTSGGTIWGSHIRALDEAGEDCLTELLRYVEGTEAVIVLENFPRSPVFVEDRMQTIERIDHPQLGLLLDIGHVRNGSGENPMTLAGGPAVTLGRCGDRLRFLHLHGYVDRDHYPPFCDGDRIQWTELFQKLHDIGYPGYFNFEPRGPAFFDDTLARVQAMPARIAALLAAGS